MGKKGKSVLVYVLVLAGLIVAFMFMMNFLRAPSEQVAYSEVVDYFQQNKVKKFELDLGTGELQATVEGR